MSLNKFSVNTRGMLIGRFNILYIEKYIIICIYKCCTIIYMFSVAKYCRLYDRDKLLLKDL